MTYATSTLMNASRKYNTIKTDAPDYLLVILSHYSSKSDGSCSVCLPSVALPRTFRARPGTHVHAKQPRFDSHLHLVLPFFRKNESSTRAGVRRRRQRLHAQERPCLGFVRRAWRLPSSRPCSLSLVLRPRRGAAGPPSSVDDPSPVSGGQRACSTLAHGMAPA